MDFNEMEDINNKILKSGGIDFMGRDKIGLPVDPEHMEFNRGLSSMIKF
jgi:hypothetical protein